MCDGKLEGDCKHIASHGSYGLNLDKGFSSKQKKNITTAVEDVAYMLWVYTDYDTPWDAWKAVYGGDFSFDLVGGDDCTSKKGRAAFACTEHNKIKVARFYGNDLQNIRLMVHELGHAFDLAICRRSVNCDWFNQPGGAAYDSLGGKLKTCETTTVDGSGCLGRFSDGPWSGENAYWGFAGGWDNWQFGIYESGETWEVFADMYVGWVYGSWQSTDRGRNRSAFMNTTMSGYLRNWIP